MENKSFVHGRFYWVKNKDSLSVGQFDATWYEPTGIFWMCGSDEAWEPSAMTVLGEIGDGPVLQES